MSRVSDTGTDLSAAALPAGDFRNSSSAGKIEEFLMRARYQGNRRISGQKRGTTLCVP
jgi:hypothetical protein